MHGRPAWTTLHQHPNPRLYLKNKGKKKSPLERGQSRRRRDRGVSDEPTELTDRTDKILFIDARENGYMKDRVLRDFKEEEIKENLAGLGYDV
jgi:type I restriction-modification system DNA methylase subunit